MLYNYMAGEKVSRLGFGAMRLPVLPDGSKTIDEAKVFEMVDYALAHGVNYFDTAFPYHDGKSEIVMGKALARHPRDSWFLADKYPGHQIAKSYDPAEIFEEQLEKCGVDYFDFYLLHNVSENSVATYEDPKWGMLDYFLEQKRLGRIRHLGFSTHGFADMIEGFLDYAGDSMEFCQIQLNYLDWTLQNAKAKYELLKKRGIPIITMESVRGGKLANLPEKDHARLDALRPGESDASWGYRWLQGFPEVRVILSGVSSPEQLEDNIRTFAEEKPITEAENTLLLEIAEGLKDSVPCTACRYCCEGCPMGLDIPLLISKYNDFKVAPSINISMFMENLPEDKTPSACVACGACTHICPQNIPIPDVMKSFAEGLKSVPSWKELSRQRELAAEENRRRKLEGK